jgi:hypothetical protein
MLCRWLACGVCDTVGEYMLYFVSCTVAIYIEYTGVYGGGLISLWLYKKKQATVLKNVFTVHPLNSTHL